MKICLALAIAAVSAGISAGCDGVSPADAANEKTKRRLTTVPVAAMAVHWEPSVAWVENRGMVKVTGEGQGWIPVPVQVGARLQYVDLFVASDDNVDITVGVTARDVTQPNNESPIVTEVLRAPAPLPYRKVRLSPRHEVAAHEAVTIEIICANGCVVGGAELRLYVP